MVNSLTSEARRGLILGCYGNHQRLFFFYIKWRTDINRRCFRKSLHPTWVELSPSVQRQTTWASTTPLTRPPLSYSHLHLVTWRRESLNFINFPNNETQTAARRDHAELRQGLQASLLHMRLSGIVLMPTGFLLMGVQTVVGVPPSGFMQAGILCSKAEASIHNQWLLLSSRLV